MRRAGCATATEFASRLLNEALLAVVPGDAFGTREHIRISYAASLAQLERGMDRLEKFVRGAADEFRAGAADSEGGPQSWGATKLEPWHRDASEKIGEIWLDILKAYGCHCW